MVKVTQKKVKKTGRQISNDVSTNDDAPSSSSILTTTANNNNTNIDGANATVSGDVDDQEYVKQSNVWKYATKISTEKARCNICQIGKYHQQIIHNYF